MALSAYFSIVSINFSIFANGNTKALKFVISCKYLVMRNAVAKIMSLLACSIILMHAFVPHHHHDCEGGMGIVFEDEINCHCDCDHHDHHSCAHHHGGSHHPFEVCLLQEMLSHLVLSTNDDEQYLAALIQAEAQAFFTLAEPVVSLGLEAPIVLVQDFRRASDSVPRLTAPVLGAYALRGPPA